MCCISAGWGRGICRSKRMSHNITNYFSLAGKHIVIAGASGGLGSASAWACALMGARLTLLDLSDPRDHAEALRDRAEVKSYGLDNTSASQVERVISSVGPIDALADCSGIYQKGDWVDSESWMPLLQSTIDINVAGPINLIRSVLPIMIARGSGRIVLTSSAAGRNAGSTISPDPAYVASKGAIISLTRYFARQVVDKGITVNAVAPGPIMTPMLRASQINLDVEKFPMRRFGQPEEVGWPVAFLCSPASGYMTGVIVDINGGMHFS